MIQYTPDMRNTNRVLKKIKIREGRGVKVTNLIMLYSLCREIHKPKNKLKNNIQQLVRSK